MPLTYPAHQAPVIALKVIRPERFDGTALCVGAAAPDLAYAFGGWLSHHSHTPFGLVVWAIPITVSICLLLRWRAAAGIFAHLPDGGRLRLRSLRAIGTRRPPWWITATSAALGATSHIAIDAVTHSRRWGAQWLGFDEVLGRLPVLGDYTAATLLQYIGHTAGSAATILLLLFIADRRLVESWYGEELVESVRRFEVSVADRVRFWTAFGLTVAVPVASAHLAGRAVLFVGVAMAVAGLLIAGSMFGENLSGDPSAVDSPEGFDRMALLNHRARRKDE